MFSSQGGEIQFRACIWSCKKANCLESCNGEANQSLYKLVEREQEELQGAPDRRIVACWTHHATSWKRCRLHKRREADAGALDVDNCSIFSLICNSARLKK